MAIAVVACWIGPAGCQGVSVATDTSPSLPPDVKDSSSDEMDYPECVDQGMDCGADRGDAAIPDAVNMNDTCVSCDAQGGDVALADAETLDAADTTDACVSCEDASPDASDAFLADAVDATCSGGGCAACGASLGAPVDFLVGPNGATPPGEHAVQWRFATTHALSTVRIAQSRCNGSETLSDVPTPADGIYRATVGVSGTNTEWYRVVYQRGGREYASQSVYVNPPPGRPSSASPPILWYQKRGADPAVLTHVVASDLVTHVVIAGASRTSPHDTAEIRESIAIVRSAGLRAVWSRYLWNNLGDYQDYEDVIASSYYASVVATVRAEAEELGADEIALDVEAYSDAPLYEFLTADLSRSDFDLVGSAVEVAAAIDRVNFVYPSGTQGRPLTIMGLLARLGHRRISEGTYYDTPNKNCHISYPYDVFGAYIQLTTERPAVGLSPFFLVDDILERRYLWSAADGAPGTVNGLFLYPGDGVEEALFLETWGRCF